MRLFVFDLFGTLIDSLKDLPEPQELAEFLEAKVELTPDAAASVTDHLYGTLAPALLDPAAPQPATKDVLGEAMAAVGRPLDVDGVYSLLWELLGGMDRYAARPGAVNLLQALTAEGHCVRALSNSVLPGVLMDCIVDRLGLGLLEHRVYSGDGVVKKPNPSAFELVAQGHFTARWMIGDSEVDDYAPALALGWSAALVRDALPTAKELLA